LSNVIAKDRGCDGFTNGCFVLGVDGTILDVKLSAIGGDAWYPGLISSVHALVVDSLSASIIIELGS
jgi:hypothetical protein